MDISTGNPNKPVVPDEYAAVKAENDWTAEQIAPFADRLRGFCGLNPLKPYALEEIARCARIPQLRFGLKLHLGNSDVDLTNPEHVQKLQKVFAAANERRMAIVVHMRSSVTAKRPYGERSARAFLNDVLPFAPDVPVQIAHLAGAGGYDDPATDEALAVFVDAIAKRDPRMKNVYFDASGMIGVAGADRETGSGGNTNIVRSESIACSTAQMEPCRTRTRQEGVGGIQATAAQRFGVQDHREQPRALHGGQSLTESPRTTGFELREGLLNYRLAPRYATRSCTLAGV